MKIKERQLEIIKAAGKILIESGINGLTIKKLAEEMGFADSAVYRHFKCKEEIILTMLNYLEMIMKERIINSTKKIEDPVKQLRAIFDSYFEFFNQNPHFLIAIFSDGLFENNKTLNESINNLIKVGENYLLEIIQKGQSRQQFIQKISASDLVQIIMGSIRLQILQWRLSRFAFDLKQNGSKLMESVLLLISSESNKINEN